MDDALLQSLKALSTYFQNLSFACTSSGLHTCFTELENNNTSMFPKPFKSNQCQVVPANVRNWGIAVPILAGPIPRAEWITSSVQHPSMSASLGRSERQRGKQTEWPQERPCAQQSGSQMQTWTFWGWLCDLEDSLYLDLANSWKKWLSIFFLFAWVYRAIWKYLKRSCATWTQSSIGVEGLLY